MSNLHVAELVAAVDAALADLMRAEPGCEPLYDMLRYHLGWVDQSLAPAEGASGKKLRAVLCLLVAEAVSGDWRCALPAATAVELIHNFSLVHDDIQDQSPMRRFRETLWKWQGVAHAINAGDALFAIAEQALCEVKPHLGADVAWEAFRSLNRACRRLCEGQYLDMRWEGESTITIDQYECMIERKTACLFECAAELGAVCAGADKLSRQRALALGHHLGLGFQVVDDLLGTWVPASESGKPPLDVQSRKKTLPAVLGLNAPPSLDSDRLRALYALPRPLSLEETAEATELLDVLGVRSLTVECARAHRDASLTVARELNAVHCGMNGSGLEALVASGLPSL